MKKIRLLFERDASLDEIEVLVRAPDRDREVEALLKRISDREPEALTVTGPEGALQVVRPAEIILISAQGKQTRVVTEEGSFTARQSLQSLEQALEGTGFLRISRYELVNLDKVRKFDFTLVGTLRLELAGGMETWASRRCIPAIRRRLDRKG